MIQSKPRDINRSGFQIAQLQEKIEIKIRFPIVCVGGSAGGLESYIQVLKLMPPDMDIAIVIVNHVSSRPTNLHQFLKRYTSMPILLITEKLNIKPNYVYIIPHKCELHVLGGHFRLEPLTKPSGWPNVISLFLSSLAKHWEGLLIAVIVSGLDGDGSHALGDVKKVGGFVMAQNPDLSEWSDMPETAIKTGYVDYVLSIEDIVKKIIQIVSMSASPPKSNII